MECTKCKLRKDISEFSFKNKIDQIYYLYCDICRQNTNSIREKYKQKAKDDYELKKIVNSIHCDCGSNFVCFRDFHLTRHLNSRSHKKYVYENLRV